MLSYILGVVFRFERAHGFPPNLLCLNREHMRCLCAEVGVSAHMKLTERLGISVMIYPGVTRPQILHLFLPYNRVSE